eukprot:SAG31_NODE_680_length_12881_cov_35.655453_12_plen_107_part_00
MQLSVWSRPFRCKDEFLTVPRRAGPCDQAACCAHRGHGALSALLLVDFLAQIFAVRHNDRRAVSQREVVQRDDRVDCQWDVGVRQATVHRVISVQRLRSRARQYVH